MLFLCLQAACIELREEYVNACAMLSRHKIPTTTKEFCEAYETVCFDIPENEPDQPTLPTELVCKFFLSKKYKTVNNFTCSPPFQEILHSTPVPSKKHNPKDYTLACRYYKQRYLYVCPDPLRYGQKAVIFCPLYAEKCRVPLPGKPVVPNNEQHSERSMLSTIRNLCAQYKQTAGVFCNNFPITRPEAREACERYKRFCS
uniref:DUF4789 domain-containing protein n=1 Tax=Syphacia muris TaxID=451379 RepID=A0A0N5A949_9BILA